MAGRRGGGHRTKDLSLQTMVAVWGGDEGEIPVEEHLNRMDLGGEGGNWDDGDKALVLRMRLKGPAAAFLASRKDLWGTGVPYENIAEALRRRFRDICTPADCLIRLLTVKQESGKKSKAFADRCRAMGERTVDQDGPAEEVAVVWRQMEKIILSAYMNGLWGEISRMVRLFPPSSLEEAITRASLVEVEMQREGRPRIFAVENASPVRDIGTAGDAIKTEDHVAAVRREDSDRHFERTCSSPGRKGAQPATQRDSRRCDRCNKEGHLARVCKGRRDPHGDGPGKREGPEDMPHRGPVVKGWGERKLSGLRGESEEGPLVTVGVNGDPYRLLVDTGAEVSLMRRPIQGVALQPSEMRMTGVTGSPLNGRGTQELCLTVEGTRLSHRFAIADIDIVGDGLLGIDVLRRLSAQIDLVAGRLLVPKGLRTSDNLCSRVACEKGATRGEVRPVRNQVRLGVERDRDSRRFVEYMRRATEGMARNYVYRGHPSVPRPVCHSMKRGNETGSGGKTAKRVPQAQLQPVGREPEGAGRTERDVRTVGVVNIEPFSEMVL